VLSVPLEIASILALLAFLSSFVCLKSWKHVIPFRWMTAILAIGFASPLLAEPINLQVAPFSTVPWQFVALPCISLGLAVWAGRNFASSPANLRWVILITITVCLGPVLAVPHTLPLNIWPEYWYIDHRIKFNLLMIVGTLMCVAVLLTSYDPPQHKELLPRFRRLMLAMPCLCIVGVWYEAIKQTFFVAQYAGA